MGHGVGRSRVAAPLCRNALILILARAAMGTQQSIGDSDAYAVSDGDDDPLHPKRLRKFLGSEPCDVFVCGPAGFVDHAVRNLRAAGVPSRRVHAERFAL